MLKKISIFKRKKIENKGKKDTSIFILQKLIIERLKITKFFKMTKLDVPGRGDAVNTPVPIVIRYSGSWLGSPAGGGAAGYSRKYS